jgi:hypothetical protein
MLSMPESDHALGLELQIAELVEQRERARVQGRTDDLRALEEALTALHLELADVVARAAARPPYRPAVVHAPHPSPPGFRATERPA